MLHVDRETILEAVHRLPLAEQRELAFEILRAVPDTFAVSTASRREPPAAPDTSAASALSLRGIARTAEPLDDDHLLDESRTERYG